eukprot:TRINITY_DN3789_c0_g1_i1.p1 TRINITY_DN3789_c0_g1~~TRINITY_DN3789_c0_g1_i1.p1  ORF type:complete len:298 (-),score=36.15 TRINITY_DN3789_c0_g1_i1:470-1363(-)
MSSAYEKLVRTHMHQLVRVYYTNGGTKYFSGYNCNFCKKKNASTDRWFCSACDYNLCEPCMKFQLRLGRVLLDVNNHPHQLQNVFKNAGNPGYEKGFKCDACEGGEGDTRWWCAECGFDLCEKCAIDNSAPIKTPSAHTHPLQLINSHAGPVQYTIAGYLCFYCKRINPTNGRWWCKTCGLDICNDCHSRFVLGVAPSPATVNSSPAPSVIEPSPITSNPSGPVITNTTPTNTSPATPTATNTGNTTEEDDSVYCVVCMTDKKNATIIHSGTGHVCCCMGCAKMLQDRGDPCPFRSI